MDILRVEPQGFCRGVEIAIDKSLNLKLNNNVYCLGALIHNQIMVNRLKEKGISTISKKGATRLELLDLVPDNSFVIISAHGASPAVFKKAEEKGLKIVDATCAFVYKTHNEIKKYLSLGYDIYYIGAKGHAEAEGACGISDKIHLISNIDDIDLYSFSDKSFVINQTTMSLYDIKEFHERIKAKNPNVVISNTICMATTKRQEAVINARPCDLFIVVGDKMSSNTGKLYKLASAKSNSIMVESLNELKNYDFKNINTINITSGASTPSDVVDEIISFLKSK